MGKQSARLYYQGKDHKDIFYQGNFHDKMYKGNRLLWEKLYPAAYFVTTRVLQDKSRYVTEIILEDGVDDKAQVPLDRNIADPKSYTISAFCQKSILCNFRTYGNCITVDMRKFKQIPTTGSLYTVGDGFCRVLRNVLTIIHTKDDLSYEVSEYENDALSGSFDMSYCIFDGNYIMRKISQKIEGVVGNRTATTEWLTIDSNGNIVKRTNTYNINNAEEAIMYGNEVTLYYEDSFSVVIGNYIYWCVPTTSMILPNSPDGPIYISRSAKIIRRDLSTFNDTVLIDMEDIGATLRFNNGANSLYISTTKAVFLGAMSWNDGYMTHQNAIITTVGDEGASIKHIQDMKIRVLGEDRYVDIIADFSFAYDEPIAINKIILNTADISYLTVSSGFPTMHNGVYEPDAVAGMAFWFSYGYTNANPWYVMGYIYIDNFDFAESEKNYIYITKEYVNGELVIDR